MPLTAMDVELCRTAVGLLTAGRDGRDAFTDAAPALLVDVIGAQTDPADAARVLIDFCWWMTQAARACGEHVDRVLGAGTFDDSLRKTAGCLSDWPILDEEPG
jgi:hypothetical protein